MDYLPVPSLGSLVLSMGTYSRWNKKDGASGCGKKTGQRHSSNFGVPERDGAGVVEFLGVSRQGVAEALLDRRDGSSLRFGPSILQNPVLVDGRANVQR